MSRHWTEFKYLCVDNLWSFIDEQSTKLNNLSQEDTIESSELCKLLLLGRREMLSAICDYLHNNEATLQEIVVNLGVLTKDEVNKSIKDKYGV